MLVTSDICCVSCLRMGNDNICQHVDFFHPLADFVIDVFFFLFSSIPITAPRCRLPSVDI